ncbi:MAG: zinc ABC transporter substrate-binding protein [Oligoflexia bacterium]|nr:zinc ABC transporter substrate-binding protein [Oligoflexia bacterium]
MMKMTKMMNKITCMRWKAFTCVVLLELLLVPVVSALVPATTTASKKIIFVSIIPLKYFVDRIISAKEVEVITMVEPGQGPETYTPTPEKMQQLSQASLYLHLGLPFERVMMERIKKINPQLKIVDVRNMGNVGDIEDEHKDEHKDGHKDGHKDEHEDEDDPHIWSSPRLMGKILPIIGVSIQNTLGKNVVNNSQQKLNNLQRELNNLDQEISKLFAAFRSLQKKFLVFHPAWGYFAKDYQLQQISIERHGKSPGPRDLEQLAVLVRKNNIKTLFVTKQQIRKQAETWAKSLNIKKIVELDPLAYDYFENTRKITAAILSSFRER